MAVRVALANFTKGVVSPEVEARFDLPVYSAAVRTAKNVKIQRTGGMKKRAGLRFVAEALSSSSFLIPFQFSDDQAYVQEFAQGTMRPLALGGAVLETGLAVTAITNADTAEVTCAFHGYSFGQQVYFTGILGMTEINDRFITVLTVPDADHFTVDFDSTGAGAFTGDTGGQVNVAPPPPPPDPIPTPAPTPAPTPPPTTGGESGGYDGGGNWQNTGLPITIGHQSSI